MELILNSRYRVRNSQERITEFPKNLGKDKNCSKTQKDISCMIQTILKQCRSRSKCGLEEKSQIQIRQNQRKNSCSPFFKEQISKLSQVKLQSRTPCSNQDNKVQVKIQLGPQTTKSGYFEQRKAYFFENKKNSNVFNESQQITVKTLERDSSTVQENEPEPTHQWYMNYTGRVGTAVQNTNRKNSPHHEIHPFVHEDIHSDYMLGTLQTDLYNKIYNQYFKPRNPKLTPLNDPLINESEISISPDLDLTQKVPFLWVKQSDEGTTISKSGSRDLINSSEKDKTQQFKEQYMVGKQIGSGSYASVRHCIDRKTLKAYALKIYTKSSLSASRKRSILREIRLLQYTKHRHIVQIFDAVETNNHVNLLLELIQGKSLASTFKTNPFPLHQIKVIVYQVALALSYLHRLHITHRDIKLENVLYVSDTQEIKLIDFGFSTLMKSSRKMFCGTPSYMAPEIVRRTQYYGQPVDIWALGVMLYALLSQSFPFKGSNDKELYQKISQGQFSLSHIENEDAQDLLQCMICLDPELRITADQILIHPWFHQPLINNFGLLISKVKKSKEKSKVQRSPQSTYRSQVKTFKYQNNFEPERKQKQQGSFFDSKGSKNITSCLNSPRNNHGEDGHIIPYLQSQQQSTVKKVEQPQKTFKVLPQQHNKTIHPSFVPSFMSSIQSLKSNDSNNYLTLKQHKNSNIANQTFNDTSGVLNISFNNSFMQNDKTKLFQNFINKISQC